MLGEPWNLFGYAYLHLIHFLEYTITQRTVDILIFLIIFCTVKTEYVQMIAWIISASYKCWLCIYSRARTWPPVLQCSFNQARSRFAGTYMCIMHAHTLEHVHICIMYAHTCTHTTSSKSVHVAFTPPRDHCLIYMRHLVLKWAQLWHLIKLLKRSSNFAPDETPK